MRILIALVLLATVAFSGNAQVSYVQINGNASPDVNSTITYTVSFHDAGGSVVSAPSGTGGFNLVTQGSGNIISSGTYSITIQWTTIMTSILEYGFNDGSNSFYDDHTINVVQGASLQAPAANHATSITTTSFTANWGSSTGAATYTLDVATNSTFTSGLTTFTGITATSRNVTGRTAGTTYFYRVRAVNGATSSPNSATITVSTVPVAPTAAAATSVTQSSFTANWSAVTGATQYLVYVTVGPGYTTALPGYNPASVATNSKSITGLNGSTGYRYYVKASNNGGASASSSTITATTQAPSLTAPAAQNASNITATSFQANWNTAAGAASYRIEVSANVLFSPNLTWYDNIPVTGTNQVVNSGLAANTTYYYRVRSMNGTNTSVYSNVKSVLTLSDPPVANVATLVTSASFTANWNASAGATSYQVDVSTKDDFSTLHSTTTGITGLSLSVSNLTTKTSYYYRVRAVNPSGTSLNSNSIVAVNLDHNYIRSVGVGVPQQLTTAEVELLNLDQRSTVYKFFDGLGRPVQVLSVQASPSLKDLVQPMAYDGYGREAKKYLPYTDETNGWFKENALRETSSTGTEQVQYQTGKQYAFYQTGGLLALDPYPYAETRFEVSPSSRVIEQGAPGSAWQPDAINSYTNNTDRTVKIDYDFNGASEVLLWTYVEPTVSYPFGLVNASSGATPVYYSADKLYKTKTKDEQYNEVLEYKDMEGKVILKKVQAPATEWAETYYIYDNFGNLVTVLPPEAVKAIRKTPTSEYFNQTDAVKEAFLKRWTFRYTYDHRNRMTNKQVPGADPVYMIYDIRDRLVLTQDGNQRPNNQWSYTKYDALNRPIMTGIYNHGATATLDVMQNHVNAAMTSGNQFYEDFDITQVLTHGYTNRVFPLSGVPLTVTYYDNYNFKSLWYGNYNYVNDALSNTPASGFLYTQPVTENIRVIGQVTGTKVKVLDGAVTDGYTWLKSVNYYDDKYRVIQTKSDNYKSGIDKVSTLYDFTGKVLKTQLKHEESDVLWKDLINVVVTGNRLSKTGGSAWSGGAASIQALPAGQDGWVEFTASETTTSRMLGLSDQNVDVSYGTIDYAVYLTSAGSILIYEGGTSRGNFGTYASGDVLRIERTGQTIRYYQNQTLKYTSGIPSSSQLVVDASLQTINGTLGNVRSSFTSNSHVITRTFEYDHAGRLTHTWHKLDDGANILLSKNEYNELGQLIDKKLHSTDQNATTNKQSVDYSYNIRGWLTSMNDADLSLGESTDYFGMNLLYNTVDAGLSNTQLYNGNIAAMKWSNYGDGTVKQKGYTYTYDAMNRILSSTFKEKTTSWSALADSRFAETGFTYDLNGNIMSLTRNDKRASGTMDILAYNYGSGTTRSNKLLKVEDTGDDYAGFIDGNPSLATDFTTATDDYRYDANGNMINDRNKGIGTSITDNVNRITYNFLNLPETVTKSGNTVRYIYDATGRKLAQVVTMGTQTKQTDYAGEFVYENDALQFISHEEGRIITSSTKLIYTNPGEAVTDFTASNATLATLTQNGTEKYVKATSNGTVARTGVFPVGGTIPVAAGERYKIRMKGYRTGTSAANLLIKAGGNDLNWPGAAVPLNAATESWIEQTVTIPTGATTLQAGAVWATVTSGEVLYINEFEITKLETTTPEYQYNLKDHLGNVRLTFTASPETESATATMETVNANAESGKFLYYNQAIKVNYPIWDHTNAGATTYATRLTGANTNAVYGLAKSLSVMPGDVVNMQVYAKYLDTNSTNWSGVLSAFVSAVNGGTAPGGTYVDGGTSGSLDGGSYGFTPINHGAEGGSPPKAYLNFIVFNKDMSAVLFSDFARITTNSREYGQDCAHDLLTKSYTVKEPGYMYIYLSNENPTAVEVYFDDFKVEHIKSPVVQMDDYYAFGLMYNSYSRENTVPNEYQYNSKELQDELGLNWLDYGARMCMPEIGRWGVVDPLSEKYPGLTPYNFVANSPINVTDKDGRDWEWNWTRDKNGNINGLNLTFNGKIMDRTGSYSAKQLNALKSTYVKGMQSMLKGSFGKDFKISTTVNLSVAKSETDVKQTDHLINIISNEDMAKSLGSNVNGAAEEGGLNIWMTKRSADESLKTGSAREISHEAGHTGGLDHPGDNGQNADFPNLGYSEFGANAYNFMWGSQKQLNDYYGMNPVDRTIPAVRFGSNHTYVDTRQLWNGIFSNLINHKLNKQYGRPAVPTKTNSAE